MIATCPQCNQKIYQNGVFSGCEHHEKHDLDERAAIKEFCALQPRRKAEFEVIREIGGRIE